MQKRESVTPSLAATVMQYDIADLYDQLDPTDQRYGQAGVLVVGIDDFGKSIDIYGDEFGIALETHVGDVIRASTRFSDYVEKLAECEYLVVLCMQTTKALEELACRIQRRTFSIPLRYSDSQIGISSSIGGADFHMTGLNSLFEASTEARKRMEHARGVGGERICLGG